MRSSSEPAIYPVPDVIRNLFKAHYYRVRDASDIQQSFIYFAGRLSVEASISKVISCYRLKCKDSWSSYFRKLLPKFIVIAQLETGELIVGSMNNLPANIELQELDASDLFRAYRFRRDYLSGIGSGTTNHILKSQFTNDAKRELVETLRNVRSGEISEDYEKVVKEILDFFFDHLIEDVQTQRSVSNAKQRIDILYRLSKSGDQHMSDFFPNERNRNIIVECKNSKTEDELKKALSQVQKYFTVLEISVGLICVREKTKLREANLYAGLLREGKRLIVLDDKDLQKLILPDHDYIIEVDEERKYIVDNTPVSNLYHLWQDCCISYKT